MDSLEATGSNYHIDLLTLAQSKTWEVLKHLSKLISEGMTEEDAHEVAKGLFQEHQVEKIWHPSKIRFGINTMKSFREISEPHIKIKKGDLYFLDLGLVFNGHEGDCGQTFVLGQNAEAEKMISAGEKIFLRVQEQWLKNQISGVKLYEFAEHAAGEMDYILNLQGGNGHRISDFPHAIHYKGSLKSLERVPLANRWILEIQLRHKRLPMGAFYEDILK